MSRTHISPWDYHRDAWVAPYDGTCPKCGSACYGPDAIPNGKMYTCPNCGIIKIPDPPKDEYTVLSERKITLLNNLCTGKDYISDRAADDKFAELAAIERRLETMNVRLDDIASARTESHFMKGL